MSAQSTLVSPMVDLTCKSTSMTSYRFTVSSFASNTLESYSPRRSTSRSLSSTQNRPDAIVKVKRREYAVKKPRMNVAPESLRLHDLASPSTRFCQEKIVIRVMKCISEAKPMADFEGLKILLDRSSTSAQNIPQIPKPVKISHPPKPPPVVEADCFQELPEEMQNMILEANITAEEANESFDIICNVLHFRTKLVYSKSTQVKRTPNCKTNYLVPSRFRYTFNDMVSETDPRSLLSLGIELGRGGYGTVYLSSDASNKNYAVKIVAFGKEKEKRQTLYEVGMLKFCHAHPNIVRMFSSHVVEDTLWIIMENLDGGPLSHAVNKYNFNEPEIAYIAKQILFGIQHLHQIRIVHRDLKSSNVLLSILGDVKIADFGLCADLYEHKTRTEMVGSPYWMPPEMIKYHPHSESCDIWSFAISLLELANTKPPHSGSSIRAMFKAGTEGCPNPLDKPEIWTPNFKDFLLQCLHPIPSERASVSTLLEHDFLSNTQDQSSMENVLRTVFLVKTIFPLS